MIADDDVAVLRAPRRRRAGPATARPRRRSAAAAGRGRARRRSCSARSCPRRRPSRRSPASRRAAAWPGWYLPVSTPWAIGDHTIWPMPSSSRGRHDLGLDDPPEHVVLRLVRDERDPQLAGQRVGLADLLGAPLGDPDVVRLAGVHDVGERLHRLLERRLVVVAVRLVEVDVVGPEPGQRAVDRLADVLAGQPRVVVLARAGRPVDLGEDLQALAGARPSAPCRGPSRPSCSRRRRRCRRS